MFANMTQKLQSLWTQSQFASIASRLSTSDSRIKIAASATFWPLLIACAISFGIIAVISEGVFSPDSVIYIDAARNLASGDGLTVSLADLDDALSKNISPPTPLTMWAPVYPILIAALSRAGLQLTQSALVIPAFSFGLIALAAFLAARRSNGIAGAMFAAAALIVFEPLRSVSSKAWSESTALALTFLFFWNLRGGKAGTKRLFISGLFAGLAFATRYAMLPMAFVGAVACARTTPIRHIRQTVAFLAGFALMSSPVFLHNYLSRGNLLGEHTPRKLFGYIEVSRAFLREFANAFLGCGTLFQVMAAILLIASIASIVYRGKACGFISILKDALWTPEQQAILLWIILYSTLLLRSEVQIEIDPISERLVAPATITTLLYFAIFISRALGRARFTLIIAAFILLAATAWRDAPLASKISDPRMPRAYAFEAKRSPTFNWITENITPKDLLIAEDSFRLPLFFGPAQILYTESWRAPSKPVRYEDIVSYLNEFAKDRRNVYLILRAGMARIPKRAPGWGTFFDDVAAGHLTSYPGITPVAEFEDGRIYKIECSK